MATEQCHIALWPKVTKLMTDYEMIGEILVFFGRFGTEPHSGYLTVVIFLDCHYSQSIVGIRSETCPAYHGERRYGTFECKDTLVVQCESCTIPKCGMAGFCSIERWFVVVSAICFQLRYQM